MGNATHRSIDAMRDLLNVHDLPPGAIDENGCRRCSFEEAQR